MAQPTIFKAPPREEVRAQIGDEIVDLSRLPMGALIDVIELVGTDADETDLGNVVGAIAALCERSNPNITKEFLLEQDAEVVIPFMQFALNVAKKRMDAAGALGLKNGTTPSN